MHVPNQIVLIMRINKVRKINFMQYVVGRVTEAGVGVAIGKR